MRQVITLSSDQEAEIRARFQAGETAYALGKVFNIATTRVKRIATGESYVRKPFQGPRSARKMPVRRLQEV